MIDESSGPTPESAANPPPGDELVERILHAGLGATRYARPANLPAVGVPVTELLRLMTKLHESPGFNFELLVSHTAVDRIGAGEIELVYTLISLANNATLFVSTTVPRDNPIAPTVSGIWRIAEWQEREVYDLFGVLYDQHPDLRRVFLEDDWRGFPLRKDYADDFMLSREDAEAEGM